MPQDPPQFNRLSRLILGAAGEGIYGLDREGLTTFVNPAAARMLGWKADQLIGRSMHRLLHHHRSDGSEYPARECPIYAAFKDGAVHHVEDEVFWRKDGSSFPVAYTSTPIYADKHLVGAVVTFRDISRRKQTEEALQKAYAEVARMKERLEAENVYLQEEIRTRHDFKEIVGRSSAMRQVLRQIELVAATDANVLITGESGTGKELIARAIHERSQRSDRPLIRVNCTAIPRDLFESEFFGHVRGAFTGALKDRAGRFELADSGTIFLDEVGEIPLERQAKLLHVLQEGQFERVGEEKTRAIDVRVIAATNRDLKADIQAGRFREDLYFRLNVFPIEAAPLRKRRTDIPLLAQYFSDIISARMNRTSPRLTHANLDQLKAYHWPGNVRELQNVIERALITARGKRVQFDPSPTDTVTPPGAQGNADAHLPRDRPYTEQERLTRDRANIIIALRLARGRISGADGAADMLGLKPTTLASRMKAFGIDRSPVKPDRSN